MYKEEIFGQDEKGKDDDMKQTKKKPSKQKKTPKITAYIGVFSLLCVGLVSIAALRSLGSLSPKDNPTTLIPSPPPYLPTMSSALPQKTASPTKEPTEAPKVQAVFAQEEPFILSLPLAGDVLLPFSKDKLLYSKTLGDWRTHGGLDLAADSGTAVMAAADGTVTEAYFDPLMGHTIEISHKGDQKTRYQNLASTEMVSIGQEVSRGQTIAAVGNSATAELLEDSHLHFALLEGGEEKNPMDFVK